MYVDTLGKYNLSSFLIPTEVGGRCPLPLEICALSDSKIFQSEEFDLSEISRNPSTKYLAPKWPTTFNKSRFRRVSASVVSASEKLLN